MVGGIEAPLLEEELAAVAAAQQGVIFVLESANLEVAKVGKNYELLNCDDHAHFLRRHNKDPALYRPDICHQARCDGCQRRLFSVEHAAAQHRAGRLHGQRSGGQVTDFLSLFLQALLMILDSPLNKAGKLKALYVHTNKNVLIQVNPQVRAAAARGRSARRTEWGGSRLGAAEVVWTSCGPGSKRGLGKP